MAAIGDSHSGMSAGSAMGAAASASDDGTFEMTTGRAPRSPIVAQQVFHLRAHRAGGVDDDGRESRVDERDRAVLEVGRGIRLHGDVRQLLGLERDLERRGEVEAAAQHDAVARVLQRGGGGHARTRARHASAAATYPGTSASSRRHSSFCASAVESIASAVSCAV